MERKEEFVASKILIDFIRDFTLLTEQQIIAIRRLMESTVRDVMSHVTQISNLSSEHNDKANKVIVSGQGQTHLVLSNRSEIEKKEQILLNGSGGDLLRKAALESQLMRAGGLYTKHLEALSRMDTDVQALISRVVGSVSNDDVMAQRLSHVISSLNQLQLGLSEVLGSFQKYLKPEAIKGFRNKVLTQVYLSYTSNDEREIFHRIFGHPKEIKKAS